MTWEEINENYDKKDGAAVKKIEKGFLGDNWKNLMSSADKLVWLFMISESERKEQLTAKVKN